MTEVARCEDKVYDERAGTASRVSPLDGPPPSHHCPRSACLAVDDGCATTPDSHHRAIVNFAQAAPYPTLANPHLTRRRRITTAIPNARSGALLLPSSSPMPDWLLPLVVTTIASAHAVVDRWS